jgi:hypothetical protein
VVAQHAIGWLVVGQQSRGANVDGRHSLACVGLANDGGDVAKMATTAGMVAGALAGPASRMVTPDRRVEQPITGRCSSNGPRSSSLGKLKLERSFMVGWERIYAGWWLGLCALWPVR